MKAILGIDIAKLSFDAALLIDKKFYCKKFSNDQNGFTKLGIWLQSKKIASAHACMEATGNYGLRLAEWLSEQEFIVSIVNPASIKGFAQSQLSRNKTDKADAKLIARFTQVLIPEAWIPPRAELGEVSRCIKKHMLWLENELIELEKAIQQKIDKDPELRNQNELLQSIPGIGEKTSASVLAYVTFERFKSAKEISAFIGVNPRQRTSGTSVRGRTRLSKTGNAYLRKSLYMPSLAALRFNDTIKSFAQQLANNGKSKMVIIGAVMRKLVHIMYGVLKSGRAFDPAYTTQKFRIEENAA